MARAGLQAVDQSEVSSRGRTADPAPLLLAPGTARAAAVEKQLAGARAAIRLAAARPRPREDHGKDVLDAIELGVLLGVKRVVTISGLPATDAGARLPGPCCRGASLRPRRNTPASTLPPSTFHPLSSDPDLTDSDRLASALTAAHAHSTTAGDLSGPTPAEEPRDGRARRARIPHADPVRGNRGQPPGNPLDHHPDTVAEVGGVAAGRQRQPLSPI
jgi:hypothetical protein